MCGLFIHAMMKTGSGRGYRFLVEFVKTKPIFLLSLVAIFTWISFSPLQAKAVTPLTMQSLIDQAKPGDTIDIPPGSYTGPVIITKPLTIQANGDVKLTASGDQPILTIKANHVQLSGVTIIDQRKQQNLIALLLAGDSNRLQKIQIATQGTALKMEEADNNQIEDIRIRGIQPSGQGARAFTDMGNGIDLWESVNNVIKNCHITNMHDGIYSENCNSNQIVCNHIENSRYAIHMMYSNNTWIQDNESVQNVTGAMIMEADQIQITGNRFLKSSENANSQGILLYRTFHSTIDRNQVANNRLGFYVELSENNTIKDNQVAQNFIGFQMTQAKNNQIFHNSLLSNVIQAQAKMSVDNQIHENYWDTLQGIDFNGDGLSELPYKADPFFLTLTSSVPPFQIFFQSPGILILEELFKSDTEQWMTDTSPLMRPPFSSSLKEGGNRGVGFLISSILFLLCIFPFLRKGAARK